MYNPKIRNLDFFAPQAFFSPIFRMQSEKSL